MVCHGPDPPESHQELSLPPGAVQPVVHSDDSDDEIDYDGYEPLPQTSDGFVSIHTNDDESDSDEETNDHVDESSPSNGLPSIDSVEREVTREVWTTSTQADTIAMDLNRVQEVMSAMANFVLPESSIPDWAQVISEDLWKQQLKDKIDVLKTKR